MLLNDYAYCFNNNSNNVISINNNKLNIHKKLKKK